MTRHYEITDGNLHVGWASEDYVFTKMDERVLKGEAKFDFHVGDRDAVDVAPVRHGNWIMSEGVYARRDGTYCSECGWSWADNIGAIQLHPVLCVIETNFCPNCGALMDVSDTDVGKMEEAG